MSLFCFSYFQNKYLLISKDVDIFAYNINLSNITMREKIAILIACLAFAVSNVSAKSLVLTLSNGKRAYYLLGEDVNPMLRFVDGGLTINTDRYEFRNVKNFYISSTDDPNGIEHIMGDMVRYSDNKIIFDADTSTDISTYTLDGRKVNARTLQTNGKFIVDLSDLPQGNYIVTVGETTLKIHKK